MLIVRLLVSQFSSYKITSQNSIQSICYNFTGFDDHAAAAEDAVVISETFPTNASKMPFVVEHPLT